MIVYPDDIMGDVTESCDVCIIGSGSSGGVMAVEMAEAGYTVIVLEEGGYYTGADLNQREADMMGALYQQRGARGTKDLSVSIMQGKTVGGGTVVNVADCVRILDPVLRRWEKEFGITDMTPEIMKSYFEKAESIISATQIPVKDLNGGNSMVKKGVETLGYSGDTFHHNSVNCRKCGYCLLGCTYNAKQAVSITYIPRALEAGAKLFVSTRAEKIVTVDGKAKKVKGVVLNPKTGAGKANIEITAQVVMVAANTINTDQLLLNSGIANSSGLVGKNLILQPQTMVAAEFDEKLDSHRGITQAYFCDEFEEVDEKRGLTGFRMEAAFGLPGIVANVMPGFGARTKEIMTRYNYMASMMILVPEEPSGEVKLNKYGRPVVHYSMRDDTRKRMMQGMKEGAKVMFAAGAKRVIFVYEVPTIIEAESELSVVDEMGVGACRQTIMAFHIQGTCRMGPDPKTSVVNNYMESHDVKNLFVVDASVCPSTSSSHNMVAVMAMAHRAADYVLTNKSRYFS